MKEEKITVGDAAVRELACAGVSTVFGVISIHNMPIYDSLCRHRGFRVVAARTESGAANMADAYARASGRLGVVLTSTGTAAGNAMGAMIEAWCAGSPVLHITGQVASHTIDTGRGYIHESKDQLAMLKAASKAAYRVTQPDQVVSILRRAILEATRAPAGPVSVEIPIDFQTARINPPAAPSSAVVREPQPEADLLPVADKMAMAKRPVIWAGGGVISSDASMDLTTLAELIGAPVITSQRGRGSIPETHPLAIGHFATYPEVRELVERADLLISVGVRFRGNETLNWRIQMPEEHIGIDADAAAMDRNYSRSCAVVGDAQQVLRELVPMVRARKPQPKPEYRQEVERIRTAVRQQLRDTLGPYERFLDAIRDVLPEDTIVVRDVTIPTSTWASRLIEIRHPRTSIHAAGGGMGQGLAMAIGAQIACPSTVVMLICGDGGFLVNVGELATAHQEALPLVVVLFDDRGYGVLRNIQDAVYEGRNIGVELQSPDFVTLGGSFGFEAARVGTPEDFQKSLRQAVAAPKPSLIVVDVRSVGPVHKPFTGPAGGLDVLKPH